MISTLKERITLQKRRVINLENGDVGDIWENTQSVWASISPIVSKNITKSTSEKYAVCIRYRAGGISGFLWNNKPYVMIPPFQINNNRWIKGIAMPRGDAP